MIANFIVNHVVNYLDRTMTNWERRTREARIEKDKSQEEKFADKQLKLFD